MNLFNAIGFTLVGFVIGLMFADKTMYGYGVMSGYISGMIHSISILIFKRKIFGKPTSEKAGE